MNGTEIPVKSLQELQVLTALIEANSFTDAAENVGISKAVVSKTIKILEDRLNTQLFERTTRSCKPTPTCIKLGVMARAILSYQKQRIAQILDEAKNRPPKDDSAALKAWHEHAARQRPDPIKNERAPGRSIFEM